MQNPLVSLSNELARLVEEFQPLRCRGSRPRSLPFERRALEARRHRNC